MALARVIRTTAFDRHARRVLATGEVEKLEAHIAAFPESGDLVPGTGGLRKLRWASKGHGKRGGARVLYYFHLGAHLVFLLHVFSKSQQADIPAAELREWKARLHDMKKAIIER